jgi:hypothetical protein
MNSDHAQTSSMRSEYTLGVGANVVQPQAVGMAVNVNIGGPPGGHMVDLSDRLPASPVVEGSVAVSPASPALEQSVVGDFAPVVEARSGPLPPMDVWLDRPWPHDPVES